MKKILVSLLLTWTFVFCFVSNPRSTNAQFNGVYSQTGTYTATGVSGGLATGNTATNFNVGVYQLSWVGSGTVTTCTIQVSGASTIGGSYTLMGATQNCSLGGAQGSYSFYVAPAAGNAFVQVNLSVLTGAGATIAWTLNAFPGTAIPNGITFSTVASASAGIPAAGGTCTTPAVAAGSTDFRGQVSSASCTASQTMTATFKQPYAVAPFCIATPANAAAAVTASAAAVTIASASTTVLTVTSPAAATTAGAWNYICVE